MQHDNCSDQELIQSYLNGNDNAFDLLLKRHQDRIYTQIVLLVRDNEVADDIFQETFMKAIRTLKMGRYNEEGKFLPWILRIAHNLSIDHFRRNRKMPTVRSDDDYDVFGTIPQDDLNVEEQWITDLIHSDVRKLIDFLPEEQREVVLMRHYEGLSFKEIAEKSNVSINTSLGRMRYALINMRKIVEQKNIILSR